MEQLEQSPRRANYPLALWRPAIWVAGVDDHPLRGGWVDAARPAPLLRADITDVLSRSGSDDAPWIIHHYRAASTDSNSRR